MLKKIPSWLKNKYAITSLVFAVWILFFDQNNILTQAGYRSELNTLLTDSDFYKQEIETTSRMLQELSTNPKSLEKFARENYLMKKENEEVFVFVQEEED